MRFALLRLSAIFFIYAFGALPWAQASDFCSLDGVSVASGSSRRFFEATKPPPGRTCSQSSTFRSCQNGSLLGDEKYAVASCENPLILPAPSVSPASGSYASPASIVITSVGASFIRYTLDGSEPTCEIGARYTDPVLLFESATVKAVACNVSLMRSATSASITYVLNSPAPLCSYQSWFNEFTVMIQNKTAPKLVQKRCYDNKALFANRENGTPEAPRFDVIALAPLPAMANDPNYAYHPVTLTYAQPSTSVLQQPAAEVDGVKQYMLPWSNRCHWNTLEPDGCACKKKVNQVASDLTCYGAAGKGNSSPYVYTDKSAKGTSTASYYTFFFTSVAKADACTIAQSLAFLGASEDQVQAAIAKAPGLTLATTKSQLDRSPQRLLHGDQKVALLGKTWVDLFESDVDNQRGPWIYNTCYVSALPGGPLEGIAEKFAGIALDYEVGDMRTPAQAASFIADYSAAVKGQRSGIKLLLFSDPVNASAASSGITTASGPQILKAVDGVPVDVSPGLDCSARGEGYIQAMEDQMKIWNGGSALPADKSKFILQYAVNNDENIGSMIRQYILKNGIKFVDFTQAYVRQESCDVSAAGNTPWTPPVLHAKNLFALPDPNP